MIDPCPWATITGAATRSPADAATVTTPDWVNVVSYGADPTGASDSTSAIQDAVNALPATGGVVYLPAGTYAVRWRVLSVDTHVTEGDFTFQVKP